MNQRKIQIGVIGGREESPENLEAARQVGFLIAKKGAVLFCGGLGGVMAAACEGAKEAFGLTVGILPSGQGHLANPFVDIVIPTNLGVARNSVIINACDGVIAVGGKYGTLSEIAFALQREIPVISLNSWEIDPTILIANTPEEAISKLYSRLNQQYLLP